MSTGYGFYLRISDKPLVGYECCQVLSVKGFIFGAENAKVPFKRRELIAMDVFVAC